MLSGVYILVLILSYVGADCGCLRCSKHLQGIDIRGPQGRPIKVIFKRPPPKTDTISQDLPDSGFSAAVQLPYPAEHQTTLPKFYNYKIDREINGVQKGATETKCQCEAEGQSYSALVQIPVTEAPKPQRSLCNLQYHTDSVLVPPPKCYDTGEELVNNPFPIQPLTKPLRNNQNQPTCPCCCRG
ncbi:uncharacterized protein LOC143194324 [Rhynchophorus ferrugineus]|uniref:uncharacterized protein LOC143194324 n=1 Tax=Rhynchophorus ferrugineus TaxID=354439 RepID=UPI003FCC4140